MAERRIGRLLGPRLEADPSESAVSSGSEEPARRSGVAAAEVGALVDARGGEPADDARGESPDGGCAAAETSWGEPTVSAVECRRREKGGSSTPLA